MALLCQRLMEGVAINIDFDFTANRLAPNHPATSQYLLVDLDVPAGMPKDRIVAVVNRCDKLLRGIQGVQEVLALGEHPFDLCGPRPCILAQLASGLGGADRAELAQTIRVQWAAIDDCGALVRLRDLSGQGRFPRCAYPIDLALIGPQQDELQRWGQKLVKRLGESKQLTDLWLNTDAVPQSKLSVDIDRASPAFCRLNGQPMLEITGNPTAGFSLGQIRSLCERLAEDIRLELNLLPEYRLNWLQDVP